MKIFKTILNIISAVIASLLVPVLVAMLIATPLIGALSSLFSSPSDTWEVITESVSVSDFIRENEELRAEFEKAKLDEDTIDEIFESDAVADFVDFYVTDLVKVATGERKESKISKERAMDIVEDNMDEIVRIVKKTVPAQKDKTNAEIAQNIRVSVDKNYDAIIKNLPDPEKVVTLVSDQMDISVSAANDALQFLSRELIVWCHSIIILLCLLILLLRLFGMQGFVWVGAVFILSSVLLTVTSASAGPLLGYVSDNMLDGKVGLAPVSRVISRTLDPYAMGYMITGIVLIVIFVALRLVLRAVRKGGCADTSKKEKKEKEKAEKEKAERERIERERIERERIEREQSVPSPYNAPDAPEGTESAPSPSPSPYEQSISSPYKQTPPASPYTEAEEPLTPQTEAPKEEPTPADTQDAPPSPYTTIMTERTLTDPPEDR